MSATRAEDLESVATRLTQELKDAASDGKPNEGITEVLQRIQNSIAWTHAFSESEAGRALELAVRTCATAPERWADEQLRDLVTATLDARAAQLRDDDIRETEARWWNTEPVPEGVGRITLEFRDATADHKSWSVTEVWPPETIECAESEPFERVAQRFRVQANRKHRHPFAPTLCFDAVLKSGPTSFDSLAGKTVADILGDLTDERAVPYVRKDEDNHSVYLASPARHFEPWERTLPEWFATPEHWVEPTPPPGYAENLESPPAVKEQYYKKIPTLHLYASGRHIVPSAEKPEIISRAIFLPVHNITPTLTRIVNLSREDDLVSPSAHLVPGKITLDQARALLGRVVQSSTEPRPDPDAPPAGKRRKVNKYATQSLGIAWGLEADAEGKPSWLHCVEYSGLVREYVLDLSGANRTYGDWGSPIELRTIGCAWLGAAVLPADIKATGGKKPEAGPKVDVTVGPAAEGEKRVLSHDEWYKKTQKWIKALNRKKNAPVVEVGPDGEFVGGDLGTSKGEDDEFEAEITGAKPGVWVMSVEPAEAEEGEQDDPMGDEHKLIRFTWAREGTVNYDRLPTRNSVRPEAAGPDAEWENVATFSVDSGMVCLFSKHALETILSTGTDREAMLEAFIDDDEGTNVFVPSGVVVNGDDGGYEIKGRRDNEGRIVELKLRV